MAGHGGSDVEARYGGAGDPMKPTLKAPVYKSLQLQYDELLSNLGFKFNVRRYSKGGGGAHDKSASRRAERRRAERRHAGARSLRGKASSRIICMHWIASTLTM